MKRLNSHLILSLGMALVALCSSCVDKGNLFSERTIASIDPKDSNHHDKTPTATPSPSPTPDQGTGATPGCGDTIGEVCKGGYDAAINKKMIPSKIIFMAPAGQTISDTEQQQMATNIINTANQNLVIEGHKLIQFETAKFSFEIAPAMSTVQEDSDYMINNYGSTTEYVLIIVKGFMPPSGGTIGYSPGLRIDWKSKTSIVVMDYNYIKNNQNGATVIVHELFHGLGAPHSTDYNGTTNNVFQAGLVTFKDLKYGDGIKDNYGNPVLLGQYVLDPAARKMAYDFKVYLEDFDFRGVRNVQGYNWDTRTMMFPFASPYKLFLDSETGFNGAYSNILNVYYDSYVK